MGEGVECRPPCSLCRCWGGSTPQGSPLHTPAWRDHALHASLHLLPTATSLHTLLVRANKLEGFT